MAFDRDSTTDEVIAGINLQGKVAVVTGASAGLGIETSRALAAARARVVMLARDMTKLEAAMNTVRATVPDAQLESGCLDLAALASVRTAAAGLLERFPRIDLLIANAGVMACPQAQTADGFELQFGTNHLGHFLLCNSLTPALVAAAPARVVVLSSAAHKMSDVNLDDPNYRQRDYEKWAAYGQSKTANALFALGLNTRLCEQGVTANAVHPGMIMTELGRHLEAADIEMLRTRAAARRAGYKSIPAGAATSVWAAVSPELAGRGGLYLEDCQIAVPQTQESEGGYAPYALDAARAEALWQLSEQLLADAQTQT